MKKLMLFILGVAFSHSLAFPQGCLPEGIYFHTQAEIDSFQINYPSCSEIEGNVIICGDWYDPSDINNLNGLSTMTSIGGNFAINGCGELVNLTGLENLTSVAGDLILNGNYAMTSFSGLESLSTIGGKFWIGMCIGCGGSPEGFFGNPVLTDVSGLENLTAIGGEFQIGDNGSLTSLTGLANLNSIAGDLIIFANDSLTSLSGLENLISIPGKFFISFNHSLTSLSGIENLTTLEGDLMIEWNRSLISLSGIENINATSIENLTIINNISLSNCDAQSICDYLASPNGTVAIYANAEGCNNPPEIASDCGITLNCLPYGNYYFYSQADIDIFHSGYPGCVDLAGNVVINGSSVYDLSGLMGLASIEGNIDIGNYNYGTSLTNLSGLDSLSFIGGNFTIRKNNNLLNLTGLDKLNFIAGDLAIGYNSSLEELTGLENLDSIGGGFTIKENQLENLEGLSNLRSIRGGFSIGGGGDHDYHLISLSGVESLTSIGALSITHTTALTNISGLMNVNSVGGGLYLFANHVLNSLTGLDNVEAESITGITIQYNNSLSTCDVHSVCDFLSAPNGTISIHDNASGCNSPEEVVAACEQHCLPDGITFTTQAEIDNFQTNYPGCTEIEGDVIIGDNYLVTDINHLDSLNILTSIWGSLTIKNNPIASLSGLENLDNIGGNLSIGGYNSWVCQGNDNLVNLTGLNGLDSIRGDLIIQCNQALTNLTGLERLTKVGGTLNVGKQENKLGGGNPSLVNLTGLTNLTDVQNIKIVQNSTLTSLTGLEGMTSIKGNLYILNNPITSLSGVSNLSFVGGSILLRNTLLENLSELENLEFIGGLYVTENEQLQSLTGLENIEFIGGSLGVAGNDQLVDLSGLANIDSIGGWLSIGSIYGVGDPPPPGGNNLLTDLSALINLKYVGEGINIGHNNSLSSLAGLENINAATITDLLIGYNFSLSTCEVQSVCDYLSSPNGMVIIEYNAPGCNSPDEVNAACTFSIEPIGLDDQICVYPNPADKTVSISGIDAKAIREIVIYNQTGQKVLQCKPVNNKLDISQLRPGMFIVELLSDQGKVKKKLVIE